MRATEVKAVGDVAGAALARPVELVADVQRAMSSRVFGALGVLGAPVRLMHDGISSAVNASVRTAIRTTPRAVAGAVSRLSPVDAPALADTPAGSVVLGALNGAWGDAMARDHDDLALQLTVRRRGRVVTTDSEGLARAFPDATPRIAVFVHGLCETDEAWHFTSPSYGSRLREQLGYTPVYVRYNTGLHISDNGRRLAEVLDQLVKSWPVGVGEVTLVGHSMGGLVARSACHYGHADGHRWAERVRHVFCLGTPHLGAPLEKFANVGAWALSRLPETRPFASLINSRSEGIKDLRYGSCVEEDWCDCDPDEFLRDRCNEVPFLECATYYFVGATLTRRSEGPLAAVLGDLLVQFPSASGNGKRRRIPFEVDNGVHLGRVNHMQLLGHPAVYSQMRTWIERGAVPALPAP